MLRWIVKCFQNDQIHSSGGWERRILYEFFFVSIGDDVSDSKGLWVYIQRDLVCVCKKV